MNLLQAIVLGIVQGLTEFLPISSSAHLRVVPALLGWDDPGAGFTAVIQLGTIAAVILYFARDIRDVTIAWVRGFFHAEARREPGYRMGWMIFLGTIPIGVLGLIFKDQIETSARSLYVIGTMLVVFSFVMIAAERVRDGRRDLDTLAVREGVLVGVAQALALVPGVSRSGSTISAGLLLGLDRTAAARFSFLLSIPAITLSGLYELKDVSLDSGELLPLVVATVVSFAVGLASIAVLLRFLRAHRLDSFAFYRIALGVLVLVLAARGAIS